MCVLSRLQLSVYILLAYTEEGLKYKGDAVTSRPEEPRSL
jgi:hypothetical protein